MKYTLTFHYGAIKPNLIGEMKQLSYELTFHYGAIKPA